MQNLLSKKIHEKISHIDISEKNIFVLKGIALNLVEKNFIENICVASKNPLQYFFDLLKNGRKFFTYEEFLILKSFMLSQYDAIYILNNNLYADQYPIETDFDETTKNNLLEHFKEPETENGEDTEEIILGKVGEIFTGLREYNKFLIGVYNDENIFDEPKIQNINLFESATMHFFEVDEDSEQKIFDISDESDFVFLVKNISENLPQKIFVRLQNCAGDTEKILEHLKILQENFIELIKIHLVRAPKFKNDFESRDDYKQILKTYWGYDDFRKFLVYDLQKLNKVEKKILQISQEKIISDMVREVENCEGKTGRDIFVTAPTGSGKSVIFQVPAIYFAEKYNLLTIVISPLIGLMNDQVQNLEIRDYSFAATIDKFGNSKMCYNVIGDYFERY